MNAVHALAKGQHASDRVLAGRKIVAAIDARPDPLVVVFDRLHNVVERVVESAGTVIMDRKANVIFGDELVEARERLGIALGVGRHRANAQLSGEFEDPLIGGVILGEAVDTLAADLQPRPLGQRARFADPRVTRRRRQVSPRGKLDMVYTQGLHLPDRLRQGVLAKRDGLHPDGKTAPSVVLAGGW